ncbi:hypothetical protein [Synechococcus sp. CCY 0621]|uniref:hypothetical protein n=1 Tax=Synechococcus sp. CCY 0621 TaxID=2815603 RepID=UPI001C21444C|nr:hypothetical protein [Synechococcus sp. CCY 0621]
MSPLSRLPWARPLPLTLGLAALLGLVQQQLLLRQPPRLERLTPVAASSGPAALQARFSRPMDPASLQAASTLSRPLAHRWLGDGDTLLLNLSPDQRISSPLELQLAGRDRRGLALPPQRWQWDPRPRLLAVVPVGSGEQLHVREHDGRWRPISPVWPRITMVEPLGNGEAVAVVARSEAGRFRVWRVPLHQQPLRPLGRQGNATPSPVQAGSPVPLGPADMVFAHISANRRGELLVQAGGEQPDQVSLQLWPPRGGPSRLPLEASGAVRLLPEGGSAVVPEIDGLSLQNLPPRPPRRQTLPGSRDLSSFCPRAGRALLVRHWPDFRRSLELVEPGLAPRQLWIGPQALVATACSRGGERIWALLVEGVGRPALTLISLDRRGTVLAQRRLSQWELEPGTGLSYDPTSDRLAVVLRPLEQGQGPPPPAQVVLIEATSLTPLPLQQEALQAVWLPAG